MDGRSPIQNRATPSSPLLTASRPQKSQDWSLHTGDFYLKIPKDTKINFSNIYYLIYYSILIIIIPLFPTLQKGGRKI